MTNYYYKYKKIKNKYKLLNKQSGGMYQGMDPGINQTMGMEQNMGMDQNMGIH